jgi:hypothetical protein
MLEEPRARLLWMLAVSVIARSDRAICVQLSCYVSMFNNFEQFGRNISQNDKTAVEGFRLFI